MAAQPRIVSRREWGAQFQIPAGRHVSPGSRRWFVVHWPGDGVSSDERANVRSIERFHRQSQGWAAAPGYNYLVGQSGTIYEGCGRDVRGIHSPPRNTDGWGCCCLVAVGTQPSQACLRSTRALYDWLCSVAGRQLGQSWHGQHFATGCPGPDLTNWVRGGMRVSGTPAPGPAPPAPPPVREDMVAVATMPDGRFEVFIERPSGEIVHAWQAQGGGWAGAQAGKRRASWSSLGTPGR